MMKTWRIGGVLMCLALTGGRPGFAQAPFSPSAFVDGAIMADHDPTESFYGSVKGMAVRGAVGARLSEHNSFRFEVDVPQWRVMDTASSGPARCACLPTDPIPANITSHTAVRTLSYSFLYARHLPAIGRVQVGLLAGGSVEERDSRSSGSFDLLDRNGQFMAHHAYNDDRTLYWPAGVLGADAEVKLTSHLAVTPQFRFHTFPYPAVSIVRPGIALRWRF